jgi:hypothetical protein
MQDMRESGSRILVASIVPAMCVPRRWDASEFTSLELTSSGFRVRDGRFVEKDSVIVREYVEYRHRLERWLPGWHMTGADLFGFANAGVTEADLLLNLKIQLFDRLPFAEFLKTFEGLSAPTES